MEDIVIIGYGGHAKSVADSIKQGGKYRIVGYTDVSESESEFPYLGTDDALKEIFASGIHNAALGIGYVGKTDKRSSLVNLAQNIGFTFPAIVDPTAVIAKDAKIGAGTFVGKNAVVNANAEIGEYCIINTGSIVEHDVTIGAYSHIAVGAVLCGEVTVGEQTFIGANSTVIQCLKIGSKSVVGAGAVVTKDLPDDCLAVGVPAEVKKKYGR